MLRCRGDLARVLVMDCDEDALFQLGKLSVPVQASFGFVPGLICGRREAVVDAAAPSIRRAIQIWYNQG